MKVFGLIILTFICLKIGPSFGFEHKHNIKVNSDYLEIDELSGESIFTGKVILLAADITLKTEILKISYKLDKEGKRQLNRIDIPAKVEAIKLKNDETIIANKAYYEADLMRLTLKGDVLLNRDDNVLRTHELILYLKL